MNAPRIPSFRNLHALVLHPDAAPAIQALEPAMARVA